MNRMILRDYIQLHGMQQSHWNVGIKHVAVLYSNLCTKSN